MNTGDNNIEEFTLYLMSNSSKTYFPKNCGNWFTVKLEKPLTFQNHTNWELAITEIIYPNAICTLNGEQLVIVGKDGSNIAVVTYPSVRCTSLQDLVKHLNKNEKFYHFTVLKEEERLKLTVYEPYTVILNQTLSDILCFDQQHILAAHSPVVSSDRPSLTRHVDYLYVYSNIGQYVSVGDTKVPLLRYFPFTTTRRKLKTFLKRLYVGLNQSYIEHIEVSIRDGAGELVPFFGDDNTQLTLQFRRRRR